MRGSWEGGESHLSTLCVELDGDAGRHLQEGGDHVGMALGSRDGEGGVAVDALCVQQKVACGRGHTRSASGGTCDAHIVDRNKVLLRYVNIV